MTMVLAHWLGAAILALPALMRMGWDFSLSFAWMQRPTLPDSPVVSASDGGISLVVCTHNDRVQLETLWPFLNNQRLPEGWDLECIVVDDGSQDDTADWLSKQEAGITVVHHDKTRPGKKDALAAGIAAARHDRLVLTDVDCRPGPDWAWSMGSALGSAGDSPALILGFSLPEGGPALLQFDALRVAWQFGAEAAAGRPYMGVGRALAYRKSDADRIGAPKATPGLASGDDDLFVQRAIDHGLNAIPLAFQERAKRNPTAPASSLMDGWRRKRRHLTTAPHYRQPSRTLLAMDAALDISVALAFLVGLIDVFSPEAFLLHKGGWIPFATALMAVAVRTTTLVSFAESLGQPASIAIRGIFLGPLRWAFLATATLSNFTSSPTWTQRAPTSRS